VKKIKKLIFTVLLSPLLLLATTNSVRASCIPLMPGNLCRSTTCYANSSYSCCDSPADCTTLGGSASNATCADTNKTEFHSLRPYPANPCTTEIVSPATFCGNNLTLHDTISETYPGGGSCVTNGGKITCTYNETVNKGVTIDLSGAKLPIMGNTENVPNSTTPVGSPPPLSDLDRVNGYVSWYLNGVMNRAEDGSSKNNDYNAVNLSGPINKLLPQTILEAQRIQTINNVTANTNHNQIVVCGQSNIPLIGNIFNIGTFTPTNCYPNGNRDPASGEVFRLNNWNGDLSIWNSYINNIVGKIYDLIPIGNIRDAVKDSIVNHWNKRKPPLPWGNDPFASPTRPMTNLEYRKYYNEWRGKTCVIVPLINYLVCFDNILVPNTYADLYPYIPLSSTEDLKGSITIDNSSSATNPTVGGVTVSGVGFTGQAATLFFPHMQESTDLANLLQGTFVASSEKDYKTAAPTDVSQTYCSTVEVRSNKGDTIAFSPNSSLTGNLSYTASFSCDFNPSTATIDQNCMSECLQNASDPTTCQNTCQTTSTQSCTKDIYIALSTTGKIPEVDSLWSQLVAGPEAVFKRIFPKTNTAGSVGQIIDIPGSTNITYTGLGDISVSQQSTDLKFPHIGGISEYFLKGIQTALRPKGFGETIEFANQSNTASCGSSVMPNLPSASGACKLCGASIPITLQQIFEAAGQAYGVPASVIYGTFLHEGGTRLDLTEENVKKWSVCGGAVPDCDKNSSASQIPFGWFPLYFYDGYWNAVQAVDPSRTKDISSPCNLLDGAFATAKSLSQWSGGLPTSTKYPISMDPSQIYSRFPDTCYNWDLSNGTGPVNSCNAWDANTVATSQVGYGGYCPEPGKHPVGSAFPDNNVFIQTTVDAFNQYTCH